MVGLGEERRGKREEGRGKRKEERGKRKEERGKRKEENSDAERRATLDALGRFRKGRGLSSVTLLVFAVFNCAPALSSVLIFTRRSFDFPVALRS